MEKEKIRELSILVETHKLSILLGDVLLLDNRWYVTHAGLLRCAHRHRCSGIKTTVELRLSDPAANRWVFRAVVYGSLFEDTCLNLTFSFIIAKSGP